MNDPEVAADPFAHLKQRAAERADRTVERLRAGIATLRAAEHKIAAESLKRFTRVYFGGSERPFRQCGIDVEERSRRPAAKG